MIIRKNEVRSFPISECHGGTGTLQCREYLGDYEKPDAGIKFIHDDLIEPGASIGPHMHRGDEEIYVILEGSGRMQVNGRWHDVSAGDVCITRHGHTHALRNGDAPMRLLVVCAGLGGAPS